MRRPTNKSTLSKSIERQAAAWVLRVERGLTPSEQDDLSRWLAADPRHGQAMREYGSGWTRLDRLGQWLPEHSMQPNPDLLAPPLRQRMVRPLVLSLAAAAAVIIVAGWLWQADGLRTGPKVHAMDAGPAGGAAQILPDGTLVKLNVGARISEQFTPAERRIRLERGEAHFTVSKDPLRPFVVGANGVDVQAVGTAFNVRLDDVAVEVLVTEGRVQVKPPTPPPTAPGTRHEGTAVAPPASVLDARQRAVVSLLPVLESPQIATLTSGEIERVLAWQHRRLDFNAATLGEIVAEFNRHNATQIVIRDAALTSTRITASFRSDNIDAFVRLIESGFGAHSERRDREIILTGSP